MESPEAEAPPQPEASNGAGPQISEDDLVVGTQIQGTVVRRWLMDTLCLPVHLEEPSAALLASCLTVYNLHAPALFVAARCRINASGQLAKWCAAGSEHIWRLE